MTTPAHLAAIDHLIRGCGALKAGETALVLCDERTGDLGNAFLSQLKTLGAHARLCQIPFAPRHGTEPPAEAAEIMASSDLIFGLTHTSKAHTEARRRACEAGSRYLSLPEYSWDLLLDPAITADYPLRARLVRRVADLFTQGSRVHVTTAAGTDLVLDITDRVGNACPGFVDRPGSLGSPPDIEANVSPRETSSQGVVVVDGSIPCPEIGLLSTPVRLQVENGRVVRFDGDDPAVINTLERMFADVGSDKAYVVAECGVGLNDKADITGIMLTDEGANGCMHFGLGSNSTVGGLNDVPFHLDFVFRHATLVVDDLTILRDGVPVIDW